MSENKQTTDARYPLRLPDNLYEWFQEEAQRQYRSANSLMVAALREYQERCAVQQPATPTPAQGRQSA